MRQPLSVRLSPFVRAHQRRPSSPAQALEAGHSPPREPLGRAGSDSRSLIPALTHALYSPPQTPISKARSTDTLFSSLLLPCPAPLVVSPFPAADPNLESPLNGHAATLWPNQPEFKRALLKHKSAAPVSERRA
jgi:hypothetical protein